MTTLAEQDNYNWFVKCPKCGFAARLDEYSYSEHPPAEQYPGQAYFHEHNENIKSSEERAEQRINNALKKLDEAIDEGESE